MEEFSTSEKAVVASGAISIPVVLWSEWVLKQTGCGLPPGPGGSLGALDGVSYLALVGIVGYSAFTKVGSHFRAYVCSDGSPMSRTQMQDSSRMRCKGKTQSS